MSDGTSPPRARSPTLLRILLRSGFGAPDDFVPPGWRVSLYRDKEKTGHADRRLWELALAMAMRDLGAAAVYFLQISSSTHDTSWRKTGPISGFSETDYPSGLMVKGQWKTFGGPDDLTRRPDEGLSLVSESDIPFFSSVLLPNQPPGTTGLIRRLDPSKYYIACRWDGSTNRSFLKKGDMAKVSNPRTGKAIKARPVDYGPNKFTNCVADISPGLKDFLGLQGADEIVVEVPVPK